jgi:hypothetical protein
MEFGDMFSLTGSLCGILLKVEDKAAWKDLELSACVVVGGPEVRFGRFERVTFVNCVFLYDGMEVEGREWLEFMSRPRQPKKPADARRPGQAS